MSSLIKKIVTNKLCLQIIYMYKQDLALNNLQGLICHKTQPTNLNTCTHIFIRHKPIFNYTLSAGLNHCIFC